MMFTSGLSCQATVAARVSRLVPLRRVFGNVVLQPAVQIHPRGRGPQAMGGVRELAAWTDLRRSGRLTALGRLSEAAMVADADGVIAVTLQQRRVPGLESFEIVAEGTAVRGLADSAVAPVLTSLGAPELATLAAAGYEPLGLLFETGVWAIVPGRATLEAYRPALGRRNFEHPDFTAGLNEIRRGVLGRMRSQARERPDCGGVVGIQLGLTREDDYRAGSSLVVSIDAIGAPIARVQASRPKVRTALELGGMTA
jgi:uncharacterized protein YbjQ (UPF0145 family)